MSSLLRLSVPAIEQPENQRKDDAQDDGGPEREIKRCVLSTIGKIAGQAAKREIEPAGKKDKHAD